MTLRNFPELPLDEKKETVNGIIGNTQGVKRAKTPPKNPRINKFR